jgi:hypothetical protein
MRPELVLLDLGLASLNGRAAPPSATRDESRRRLVRRAGRRRTADRPAAAGALRRRPRIPVQGARDRARPALVDGCASTEPQRAMLRRISLSSGHMLPLCRRSVDGGPPHSEVPVRFLTRSCRGHDRPRHDTHDCAGRTGDRFLARIVPGLLSALGPHGFLVVTYDEGDSDRGCCNGSHGGRIATVVVGPDVRSGAHGPPDRPLSGSRLDRGRPRAAAPRGGTRSAAREPRAAVPRCPDSAGTRAPLTRQGGYVGVPDGSRGS